MGVTRQVFEQQCKRRFGTANPERMRMAHWEWMIRFGGGPYGVRQEFGLEPNMPNCGPDGCIAFNDPDWCFSRFGMSRTEMPDGRIICIAGEHEDWYDPDFCIYNDVIVLRPAPGKDAVTFASGEVEIYGYPESVFPPTDFHTATLARYRLLVIGCLGYQQARKEGVTPIVELNPVTYAIERVQTTGPAPGWIYRHHASFDEAKDAIEIRGGEIHMDGVQGITPHYGAYRLHLDGLRWEIIARQERHRRFLMQAEDDDSGEFCEAIADTFRPANVPYRWLLSEERGAMVYSVDVLGVRITFSEFYSSIRVWIEGNLPADIVHQLLNDILANLSRDTHVNWTAREVESFDNC